MRSQSKADDAQQYGKRASAEVRSTLLQLTREFVRAAATLRTVRRIAILGSLLTDKARPKDADVLVVIDDNTELLRLAQLARRLKGTAQSRLNSGADIFLADANGHYLGRICHYRECRRRVLCRARHCGAVPHLADDLDVVALSETLVVSPPLEVHPAVVVRATLPADVLHILLEGIAVPPPIQA